VISFLQCQQSFAPKKDLCSEIRNRNHFKLKTNEASNSQSVGQPEFYFVIRATMLVAVQPKKISAESLAQQLRHYSTPIFTRIQDDQILIDTRTLRDGDDQILIDALTKILEEEPPNKLGG
jgi:hypothetical protein